MTSDRIDEIIKATAYPESQSVYLAMRQVWNEVQQDFNSRTCEWVEDEADYEKRYYFSKCGFDFIFIDERDNLTDFGFKFCPKCGAKIIEAKDNKHKEDN